MTILSWDAFLIKVYVNNKACSACFAFAGCFWKLVTPVTSSQTPPACHYQALAAASCEVTMADSLQVMAINNTEINDTWFCVGQSEKKTGAKMNQLPAAIKHSRTTQADQVFFLFSLSSQVFCCSAKPGKMMQGEERHYYCLCGMMSGLFPWLHLQHHA